MAGTGHKLWANGDLVQATAFNTYLQDQVIGVYDDSSARDAAFGGAGEPTLAEGLCCYLKDTNEFQIYSGSAWIAVLDIDLIDTSKLELNKDSGSAYVQLTTAHDTEATTPQLTFRKADNTVASPQVLDDNAVLGTIEFQGYDSNSFAAGARIQALVDGAPADGDMPTELVFQVTPDGGSETPATAVTISPDKAVTFEAKSSWATAAGAANQFLVFPESGYALYNDNAGPGSDNTRVWLNGPDGAAMYIGPRSGSHTWGYIQLAASSVYVAGTLGKTAGSFDIAHPTKGGDWRLRHSFIEGPTADNIYRGTVTISGSSATIDIDEVSNMTAGTFEGLNTNTWSMVGSSGNAVTWSLSGKTLTINGPDGAVCSWMVIGERKDQEIIDSAMTDNVGKVIVEYEDADFNDRVRPNLED